MHYVDIVIYAVIAAVLLARLWSVFGRRGDEDQEPRPNPFAPPPDHVLPPGQTVTHGVQPPAELPALLRPIQLAPASLAGGLERVQQLDLSFDEKQFLQAAQQNFLTVVGDFAKNDLTRSKALLGASVLKSFEGAIAARRAAGQTLENKIIRCDAEVTAARAEDTRIFLTVRFMSEQENVLRDSKGAIVSGLPGKSEEISDVWVFSRDTKSPAGSWQIVETRS